jgi:hypothetical protein
MKIISREQSFLTKEESATMKLSVDYKVKSLRPNKEHKNLRCKLEEKSAKRRGDHSAFRTSYWKKKIVLLNVNLLSLAKLY